MASITLEDLHVFHAIDREIFSRLVVNLMRDPAQSMLVMALWLWLEETNLTNIIVKMLRLSDPEVNAIANEAVSGLRSLESRTSPMPVDGGMPLTCRAMGINISLQMLYQNKFSMISGIKTFLNNVCALIFTDILQQVFMAEPVELFNQPLVIPGFPHPTFGSITVIPQGHDYHLPLGELWGWSLNLEVPVDDRTMFLTFSRGYPVTEDEVKELFVGYFGDCVEYIQMEESTSTGQTLFARMVVRSVSTIDRILNGGYIAKFRINGKHVWARKVEFDNKQLIDFLCRQSLPSLGIDVLIDDILQLGGVVGVS
ncbi:hypothetical protein F0562_012231 [Nyssa sinensis]|uniref:RRM domain-containing protein n=1 Tax=Nyssa sinensis TaxID=561372 RepID=A0A5J4ZV34_9ASTE|nr:hypothetical protein F0562_012231 [Nyssa sinensis]